MVEEIGVRAPNALGHGLQGHRLWAACQQDLPRGIERGRAAFFGAQAFSSY